MKIEKPRTGGTADNQSKWKYTYYVCDASGNVMATYERLFAPEGGGNYEETFDLNETMIYGSSRMGLRDRDATVAVMNFNAGAFAT
ncbi:MAG: hypothetical protein COA57_13370, partial [Flavobacteriales bacterium]